MDGFGGVIGRYHWESTPWWPEPARPPKGAPNVAIVVLDDVGFAQLGCFGSDIDTPNLDALAANGLRYRNFHTTALCSPTRACVMTGRNHHSNGMGRIIELATGFPGYNARIPRTNGFLPEMLVEHGYATWAVGKWHLTPEEECHLGATRERWPLGRGFERFYGFFTGETHQFAPALVRDNHQTDQPRPYDQGYHLTEDLVDEAVTLVSDLRAVDPEKPFFLYFATGACHSPHQSPPEWIERYRGRFDRGWDEWRTRTLARQIELGVIPPGTELSPRPDWVPAWDDVPPDAQRLYARYMEAFAGYLSHTDDQLGRLFRVLDEIGDLDDTLLFVLSDNGASSEGGVKGSLNDVRMWNGIPHSVREAIARIDEIGGPRCHNNYPWGWTVAGNTPFRRWKREVHEGGVADPLIVHWPRGIGDAGGVRAQYVHAIDVLSTVLDVVGVDAPDAIRGVTQRPVEGVSFAETLTSAGAPDRHETQYYEMFGSRAIYHRGWKAVIYHAMQTDDPGIDKVAWELYRVDDDPSECHDLASQHPEVLDELIERWWIEAARYQVLPLDNRAFSAFVLERPDGLPHRTRYVYRPGTSMVPESAAVSVKNRAHRIVADVEVGNAAHGVLLAQGSLLGGWALYLVDGHLRYVHNLSGREQHRVEADTALTPGRHRLELRFAKTGEHRGTATLLVDGAPVASGEIPRFTPNRFSLTGAGLTCGRSGPLPVTDDYAPPFAFTGTIHGGVVVEVDGEPYVDPEAEAEVAITTQ
ncbi:MAG TPA: sulfatase-like hydrolase/transferase [Acidimicrobiia bacterium]